MRRLRKHTKRLALLLTALIATCLAGGLVMSIIALASLPPLDFLADREVSESTKIFDRTGNTLLYEIYGEEKRTVVPLNDLPKYAREATIAIEDANFYTHSAIDFRGLLRAVFNNIGLLLGGDGVVQGGSTITQQLAKKAFLTDERTLMRKIKEVFISYRLEQTFSKDQILELYLNQIPYGNNAYGIEAASQTYFQKPASDLTLSEAALLASLPQAPSYYSPFGSHVPELMNRKNLVLSRMAELGYLTEDERAQAEAAPLTFTQLKKLEIAPHFVLAIKQYLEEQYGEEFIRRGGLNVITTLDVPMQKIAEKAVAAGAKRNTELYKGTNAAMTVEDPHTGQILALVGSRSYFDTEIDGQFNVAVQGMRQPGSALKPFIYLAALEKGYTPETIFFDLPTEFYPDPTRCAALPPFTEAETGPEASRCFHPQNFDHQYLGPVPMRSALAQSRNITAVKALYLVGIPDALKFLQNLGITTLTDPSRYGLSLVLGGGEVHLDELVGAYSVLASDGVRHEQSLILSIRDHDDRLLESYQNRATQAADQNSVRAINDILQDPEARRPLFVSSLGLTVFDGYDVALKTGTTNDYRDAWSIGYTPNLVAGVWAGNNDNKPMEQQGGSILAAVPILSAFFKEALPLTQPEAFTPPSLDRSDKPMLNGSHTAYFQMGSELIPHVHDILYYVSRTNPRGPFPARPENDSQFANWEAAVISWIQKTMPQATIGITVNKPVPLGASLVTPAEPSNPSETPGETAQAHGALVITSPTPGSFMRNNTVNIHAAVALDTPISRVDLFWNGLLVDSRAVTSGAIASYIHTLTRTDALPQNTLSLRVTDTMGAVLSKDIVVYR